MILFRPRWVRDYDGSIDALRSAERRGIDHCLALAAYDLADSPEALLDVIEHAGPDDVVRARENTWRARRGSSHPESTEESLS